ncbi:MAG: hypothetical protein VZS44_02460 [Bacilli bacterium]|nr:hypothetical protein [Bacilli bacterium]
MDLLTNEQLIIIKGGAGLNSSMLNALIRTVSTLFTLGQAVGSAIRRGTSKKYC